jgi:3-hydroxymyristoyl/3-hydroxydecanoyl-(acyl carrier protein) dehydratase
VTSYVAGHNPTLISEYHIQLTEPIFPDDSASKYWPSMYIIEGLGQCCNLLAIITAIERWLKNKGYNERNLDSMFKGSEENVKDIIANNFKKSLGNVSNETLARIGLLGSVDVEISGRVAAGQLLSYKVQQTQVYNALTHFKAHAYVGDRLIAQGVLIGASDLKIVTDMKTISEDKDLGKINQK